MTNEEIERAVEKVNLDGMTGNERLFATGLLGEFDKCKKADKDKAAFILKTLGFDTFSIKRILS